MMRYTRTVTGEDGLTYFEDVDLPWSPDTDGAMTTALQPAKSIAFRTVEAPFHYDYHPAPRRRFVVNLSGRLGVRASGNGEVRIFAPGDILFVSDTTGKGHQSFSVDGDALSTLFLAVDDDLVNPIERPVAGDAGGFPYTRMFDGDDGLTAFQDCVSPFLEAGPAGAMSAMYAIGGLRLVRYPAGFVTPRHSAAERKIVALLHGAVEIEGHGGEARQLSAGQVLLAEDRTGRGHVSLGTGPGDALFLFAPLLSRQPVDGGLGPKDAG